MAIYSTPVNQNSNLPGVTVSIDDTDFTGSSSNSVKPLLLIGEADDGLPQQVMEFANYNAAKNVLHGGDLLKAMQLAWSPDVNGDYYAGDILAIRTQPATQATLREGTLTFTSKLWSAKANNILVSLQPNTLTDTQRLVISSPDDGVTKTYDNLGSIFSISYQGGYPYAAYSIDTDENGYAKMLTLYAGNDISTAKVVQTFPLGDNSVYPKTNALINAINSVVGFVATQFPYGNKNIQTKYYHGEEENKLSRNPGDHYINALEGDILNAADFNDYVTISFTPANTPIAPNITNVEPIEDGVQITLDDMETIQPVGNFTTTSLSGARVGLSPDSWGDLFQKFASEYDINGYLGYYLVPLTDDIAIQMEASAFVNAQSQAGNAMRTIVGGGIDEPKQQLISRAVTLNDDRTALVGSSANVRMGDGTIVDFPAYMIAAMLGGLLSGLDVGQSITNKAVNVVSLDTNFTNDELDELTGSGVIMLTFRRNRSSSSFRVVDDVTTTTKVKEPLMHEISVGESSDFLVSDMRERFDEVFIGTKLNTSYAETINAYTQTFFEAEKTAEVILDYDANSITTVIVGDTATITADIYPIRTLKKINFKLAYHSETLTNNSASV